MPNVPSSQYQRSSVCYGKLLSHTKDLLFLPQLHVLFFFFRFLIEIFLETLCAYEMC